MKIISLSIAALCLFAPLAPADRLVTQDGRVIEIKKARAKEGGGYLLEFEHGTIAIEADYPIKAVEIEGDMSEYEPQNEDERQKLEQGYVRYRGKWMTKVAYENQLRKETEENSERTALLAEHSLWHNALKSETKHFVVSTNTSQELLDYYCDLLETYYKLMNKRVGIKPTPLMRRTKMEVRIFKSRGEFYRQTGMPRGVGGYFSSSEESLNFYYDYDDPAITDWVGLHECTHLLTYLIDQQFRPQIWINEAVADFFGSADITKDKRGKLTIEPGKVQTDRVLTVQQALEDGKAVRLADLFFIERADFGAFEYAHAWSFVYFLNTFDEGKYRRGFERFFRDLYTTAKGVPYSMKPSYGLAGVGKVVEPDDIRDLLLSRIGENDLAKLEEQWYDTIRSISVDAPSARLKRGLRAVQTGDYEDAIDDLTTAIDSGLTDARAFSARAQAYLMVGGKKTKKPKSAGSKEMTATERDQAAMKDCRRAVQLDPLKARYRQQLSMLIVRDAEILNAWLRDELSEGFVENEGGKREAGLATELDPENNGYQVWYRIFK